MPINFSPTSDRSLEDDMAEPLSAAQDEGAPSALDISFGLPVVIVNRAFQNQVCSPIRLNLAPSLFSFFRCDWWTPAVAIDRVMLLR